MHPLFTFRKTARLLLFAGLAYALITGCKKDDAPGMHAKTQMLVVPLSDTLPAVITQCTLLTSAHPWYVKGWLYVSNEASLRIEAGATVHILPSGKEKAGGLVITRGSKLVAEGTTALPVTFYLHGKGSGLVLLGKAPTGRRERLYDKNTWIAGAKLAYGGSAPADSSGTLHNVHIFYSINDDHTAFPGGLLLLGAGSKTQLKNITLYQWASGTNLVTRKLK